MSVPRPVNRRWSSVLGVESVGLALQLAREVASRFRDREQVLAANRVALQQSRNPGTIHWETYGTAQGDAGIAVLCAYLDACSPSENWDVVGHDCLGVAVEGAQAAGALPVDLFDGWAGLAFAANLLSHDKIHSLDLE